MGSPIFEQHHAELERERRILKEEWQLRRTDAPVAASLRTDAMRAREGVLRDLRTALGLDQTMFAASAAAPIAEDLIEFFASIGLEIGQGYGLSECGGAAVVDRFGGGSRGSVGLPLPGYEIRIAEDGEVQVRSPANTTGYRNRPDATAELFTPDGWLRTGDIGHLDEAGRLHITDRKKDVIITSAGKNIAPTAIESLLTGNQFLDRVIAMGEGRKYLVALLTADPPRLRAFAEAHRIRDTATDELIKHPAVLDTVRTLVDEANANLSRPEQIKNFALLADQWSVETGELTPTFKLRRSAIREKYREHVERLYGWSPPDSR
jgi:long-chain acyl-CoA synthetase